MGNHPPLFLPDMLLPLLREGADCGIESGFPFQQHRWLADVAPSLLTDEQREVLAHLPARIAWLDKKQSRRVLPIYSR